MNTLFRDHVRVTDATATSSVILHAPHGGRGIPAAHRGAFTLTDAELEAELVALTDHDTDRLVASVPGVTSVVNGLSRFVVDVERLPDEVEEMARVGMGRLYTHGTQGQPIRVVPETERPVLLGFFDEYSAEVTRLTDAALDRHGRAIIIDVHSYPKRPLPYERHADEHRPELCLGYEDFHASPQFLDVVHDAFDGWEVRANEPFHGSYVPLRHYGRDARVQSVMLEIRRDVYRTGAEVDYGPFSSLRECIAAVATRMR